MVNGFSGSKLALTRDVLRDSSGNILPLAATAMLLSAAIIGSGIDISRGYRVENKLQSACDAGVLAGRRAVAKNGFDATAKAKANTYFAANFNEEAMNAHDTKFTPITEDDGATVSATASSTVDTVVLEIFGFENVKLSVDCQSSMGMGNADVMMVLDTTGSMDSGLGSGTRISALQDSMKAFYDTVALSTRSSNARIRYGFVPYSQSVNVGRLLEPDWIVDNYVVQSREAQYNDVWSWGTAVVVVSPTTYSAEVVGSTTQTSSTNYSSLSSCQSALSANTSWAPTSASDTTTVGPTSTGSAPNPQVTTTTVYDPQYKRTYLCQQYSSSPLRYRRYQYDTTRNAITTTTSTKPAVLTKVFASWKYKPVTYPQGAQYKLFHTVTTPTGTSGANVTSAIWNGCIEERKTVANAVASWSSLTGTISPSGLRDLDLDSEPDPTNDDTRWKPMWNEVAYYRSSGTAEQTSGTKAGYACPVAAQLFEEMDESAFDAYANSLRATGSTYLDLGLIWGGRLSSPDGMYSDIVNLDPDNGAEVSRHLIFMTDGDMDPTQNSQTSYGIEQNDRRITNDGTDATAKSRHLSRFRAICSAIKAKGIRLWVIAFTASLSTDLKNCASDESSFVAGDADALDEAFQEIAKNVGELRVIN